jgi:predicted nuclease of predicted toxin-antitoxin system
MPPRLYLDEHLSPRLAVQLRQHGFDVLATQEAALVQASDATQLHFAATEQRAILTFNFRDFSRLHQEYLATGRTHAGIIFSTAETPEVLRRRLLRLLYTLTPEALKNQLFWLNTFR